MGDPRRLRKKYSSPGHPYEKDRIEEENKLLKDYGLKNKREVWKAESQLRKYRTLARTLQAEKTEVDEKRTKELLTKLSLLKIVGEGAALDDVLSLSINNFLERRLQTLVFKKGLARTPKQARQFIVHGLIAVNKRKVTVPGYLVKGSEEDSIGYYGKAPVLDQPKPVEVTVEEKPEEKAPETKPSVPVPDTKPSVPTKEGSE